MARILVSYGTTTGHTTKVGRSIAATLRRRGASVDVIETTRRWVMKRIIRKAGGDTDTSRDYEYTGWADLRTLAEDFGRRVAREASRDHTAATGRRVA